MNTYLLIYELDNYYEDKIFVKVKGKSKYTVQSAFEKTTEFKDMRRNCCGELIPIRNCEVVRVIDMTIEPELTKK